MNGANTVLLSTLPIEYGKGVATHTRFVVAALRRMGYAVTVAYYEPYSLAPSLSAPLWRLGRQTARSRRRTIDGLEAVEIGCWLPELEFTNYWPTRIWKDLVASHKLLLAVTGNPLAAHPFASSGRPFLAWLGTPFTPDRRDRVKRFPIARRVVDRLMNARMCLRFERMVLNSGLILPTTPYVAQEFRTIAPRARLLEPVPVPVDAAFFTPDGDVDHAALTFIGKYNDPRKNIGFLLEVLRRCRDRGVDAVLNLYGSEPSDAVRERIRTLGLEGAVRGLRKVSRDELRGIYRRTTVFVIPSIQEGLCVAGLEAMACGCPVVTSPCGGPEDYVRDGVNGYVVPFDADAFAGRILEIVASPAARARFSKAAQAVVQSRFTEEAVEAAFRSALSMLTNETALTMTTSR